MVILEPRLFPHCDSAICNLCAQVRYMHFFYVCFVSQRFVTGTCFCSPVTGKYRLGCCPLFCASCISNKCPMCLRCRAHSAPCSAFLCHVCQGSLWLCCSVYMTCWVFVFCFCPEKSSSSFHTEKRSLTKK